MPALTVLDVARLADAAYDANAAAGPGFSRSFYGDLACGFKGSYFTYATGEGVNVVVAYAGTETDTGHDVLADIGFGAGIAPLLGPLGALLGAAGLRQLVEQFRGAVEMCRQAQWYASQVRGRLMVTGHSLGGGLASMVACSLGLAAITFNCPATSQLGFRLGSGQVFNVAVEGDPINHTLRLGSRVGTTQTLRTEFSGGAAHSMVNTVSSLSSGNYARLGGRAAFTG